MKKRSTKSGKATHASPQPNQTDSPAATAKKRPTQEQVEEALRRFIAQRAEQFNSHLGIARGMWRANRALVEAKNWPEPYRTLYMQANDGEEPTDDTFETAARSIEQISKEELPAAREAATRWASDLQKKTELSPAATNLINERGAVADPPTTTYLLLAQRFEDGKELEFLQEVELTYDENWKLRRYLAELRGLLPRKDAA